MNQPTTKCEHCGREIHYGDWPYCPHPVSNMLKPIIWGALGPGYRVLSGDDAYRATGSEFEYKLRHAPPSATDR